MRVGNTYKDKGHYARKAVWLAVGCLLFIPHAVFMAAARADDWIVVISGRLRRWSHPCLYARRDKP